MSETFEEQKKRDKAIERHKYLFPNTTIDYDHAHNAWLYDDLKHWGFVWNGAIWEKMSEATQEYVAAMRAERDALREALEEIVGWVDAAKSLHSFETGLDNIASTAQAALDVPPDGE